MLSPKVRIARTTDPAEGAHTRRPVASAMVLPMIPGSTTTRSVTTRLQAAEWSAGGSVAVPRVAGLRAGRAGRSIRLLARGLRGPIHSGQGAQLEWANLRE